MHFFKSLIDTLLSPLSIVLWLLLLAVLFWIFDRRRTAKWVCIGAAVIGWLFSTPLVGSLLLAPLESQYPALQGSPALDVRHIVVLGSSYSPSVHQPITASIDEAGFRRAVEGIRLHRLIPWSRLVFSGGAVAPSASPADGNVILAVQLGVSPEAVLKLLKPLDTRTEAIEVCRVVGNDRFLLVTSASHLPRAMEYMRRAGCSPIPAPTGHHTGNAGFALLSVFPNGNGLRMSEEAFHEYLGWIDAWFLKG